MQNSIRYDLYAIEFNLMHIDHDLIIIVKQLMKFLVTFDKSIGMAPIEKDLSPNDSVQDLQIHISLNFEQMNRCKLLHNGKQLKNKSDKLSFIFNPSHEHLNQVTVAYLSDLQNFGRDSWQSKDKYAEYIQKYPIAAVALIVLVLVAVTVSLA